MNLKKSLFTTFMLLIFSFVAFAPRPALAGDGDPWTWPGPWAGGGTSTWAGSWTRNAPQAGPWTLQPWCLKHVGCGKYIVRNRTDSWVQIYLTRGDTLESGFFTIRPGANASITLIPWVYQAHYVYWCNGEKEVFTTLWTIVGKKDVFRCPEGPSRGG
ncbi:MAG: hypothetical protein MAG431_01304 [Chloroflexi bacterium]|nr:hypothetical protein [Chloroflexota bacterium]